ncbi:MAG TPA: hypothetical protein VD905_02820, partial [Flavobacteriales bacterium]|nr:hypothetical protein [Flavobacteriales bacterium]
MRGRSKNLIYFIVLFLTCGSNFAQQLNIIPYPNSVQLTTDSFELKTRMSIESYCPNLEPEINYLVDQLHATRE